ncbi:MAG: hypothetical protein ACRYFS_14665 [Janthinobacterium lividum]
MATNFYTEFFVDRIEPHADSVRVIGRVYEGTIYLGQIFDTIYDNYGSYKSSEIVAPLRKNKQQVRLRVDKIEVYYQDTDLLESGTSGILYLSGPGTHSIKPQNILVMPMALPA